MENCRSRLLPWLSYNLGPRVTILNLFSTSEKESSKKNLRSMSLIIHDFNYPISDIRNKLLAEVFLAPNSVKRENRWHLQNTESSEEADESQKTAVFVKRFQEAETGIKRFELGTGRSLLPGRKTKLLEKVSAPVHAHHTLF